MPNIALINRTPRIRDARFVALLPALQAQMTQDVEPAWNLEPTTLHFVGRQHVPDPAHWKLWWLGNSDIAGDLGYHEADPGLPEGKIFTEDDMRYGAEISVTTSHELIEMAINPFITRLSDVIAGWWYAMEGCDPVEADLDGPIKMGFRLSNFVLQSYFVPGSSGPWDFMRLLTGPCPTRRPGGYVLREQNEPWETLAERHADGTMSHRAFKPFGRTARIAARRTSP